MNRRSFLAFLGLAPAVVPLAAVAEEDAGMSPSAVNDSARVVMASFAGSDVMVFNGIRGEWTGVTRYPIRFIPRDPDNEVMAAWAAWYRDQD